MTTHLNIGGITSHISDLAGGLIRKGHCVTVVSSGGEMASDLVRRGIASTWLDIRTKSELSPRLWGAVPKLIQIVRSKGIEVLHAHTRVTQVVAAALHRVLGIPNVTTCHGLYKKRLGRRLFPCWGVRSIAISDIVREHLVRDFCVPPSRITMIHNGLDVDRFSGSAPAPDEAQRIRKRFGLDAESIVFGIVSRVAAVKGHEHFLRAFKHLTDQYPDRHVQGLIVGDGNDTHRIRQLVGELGLEDRVRMHAAVRNPTEPLSVIDIFMFPVTWQEGFGLSVLEAMAMGIPVIASRIGAIDAIVEEGVTGFLTPVRDVEQIAHFMERLSRDRTLARRMGQDACRIVRERFSVELMTGHAEEVYRNVIQSHGVTGGKPVDSGRHPAGGRAL